MPCYPATTTVNRISPQHPFYLETTGQVIYVAPRAESPGKAIFGRVRCIAAFNYYLANQ